MRYLLLIFLVLCMALACRRKEKLPRGIFPRDKMEDIMWDMMRTGQFLNNFVLYKDTITNIPAETQKWFNKIYELHKITKADFDKSYAYYRQHPELMKEVMDSIGKRPNEVPPGQHSSAGPDSSFRGRKDSTMLRNKPLLRLDSLRLHKHSLVKPV